MNFKSVHEAHFALKNKEISSRELLDDCIKNLGQNENNAYISITKDLAYEQAKKCDEEIQKNGPSTFLTGIPYTLKDLFVTKGIRTTAGSKILYNYIPPFNGYVAKRLEEAQGVLVGKVSCDQFGMGSSNEHTPFGAVFHPTNKDYVPGGSSGGSAAAVLEKSCFYSIGTDTGGSVRLPSNFCGLVGFKPSYGRISRFGQIAYGSSLDQAAPLTNSVVDQAMIFKYLTQNDEKDSSQVPLGEVDCVDSLLNLKKIKKHNFTLGYSKEFLDNCRDDVKDQLYEAKKFLESIGVKFVEVEFPHFKYSVAVYYIIATSEASSNLARFDGIHYGFSKKEQSNLESVYVKSRSEGFGDEVKRRIILGTFSLSSGYSDEYYNKACKVRRLIQQDFLNAFKKCDGIFSPVCATTAFQFSEKMTPIQMYMNDLYTIPVNLAGLPSLAFPFGKSSLNGMPTGFQIIGKAFEEERLLQNSYWIELNKS
ncbi:MAG: Asp-tRNA(Asn)/Glu-tRNA(Gln) amidotransferase subunit GatA [Halobacteriovoraceae bacterium]|nr:Asp-tRNA(Asn)/Glu-tRNA(Gln) amidotransferase subunit GatA [Halobacteriovoraceae bacterium]